MIIWPEQLPKPLNTSVSYTQLQSGAKINVAKGAPVVLNWDTNQNRTCEVAWSFSQSQFRAFNMFYDLILNSGTEWFYINLGVTNNNESIRCSFMSSSIQVSFVRDRVNVSAVLLIDQADVPSYA